MSVSLLGAYAPYVFAEDPQPELNFKFYSPPPADSDAQVDKQASTAKPGDDKASVPAKDDDASDPIASDSKSDADTAPKASNNDAASTAAKAATSTADNATNTADADTKSAAKGKDADGKEIASKTLQGYIRVVPSGTKIPIIMDTAVDSDTSQEGDEFTARSGEDLTIDGNTVLPAGSIIKGRISRIAPPRHMGRSGSVALKFDTVTTPDNRQIPIVANLVAHGGVVHAKRGLKDVAIDSSTVILPTLLGLGIGALAGNNNSTSTTVVNGVTTSSGGSHIGKAEAGLIGVGVGAAVGIAILAVKKGKKVDVRPGDELKIELAEDLRMPM
jgi:hypothetical protein